jgi:hypothetical protein
MSDSMNSPEWDDEDPIVYDGDEPIFINDEEFGEDIPSLEELKREIFQDKVIHSFVAEAFQFNGREAINEILYEIERKMGWKLEIIATRGSIDDAILQSTNSFDEDGWIKYIMSNEFQQMNYRVIYQAELSVDEFIEDNYMPIGLGQQIRRYIKRKLYNFAQYF